MPSLRPSRIVSKLPGSFFRSAAAYGVDETDRVYFFGFFECAGSVSESFGGFQVFSCLLVLLGGLGPLVGGLPKKFLFFSDAHGYRGLGCNCAECNDKVLAARIMEKPHLQVRGIPVVVEVLGYSAVAVDIESYNSASGY